MIRRLLSISRPRFWLYLLGPFLVGYAASFRTTSDFLTLQFWYSFFFFLLPANIFLYGVNDFFDQDTDIHNDKKGTKEYRMKQSDKRFYANATLGAFLFSIPLFLFLNPVPRYTLVLFFLLAFFYSAPPLRLKAKPFLDFLSNVLYILPGVIFYLQLTDKTVSPAIVVASACWTAAMHLYSAIPDIAADKKVGLVTTAVLLGEKNSLLFCTVLWGITAFIASGLSAIFAITWVYPMITALVYSRLLPLEKIYWYFPWVNAGLGFILFWYVVLN